MIDNTIQQQNDLEEVIRTMREEREREKAARNAMAESLKSQAEATKANAHAAKLNAEANLSNAAAEQLSARVKIEEAKDRDKLNKQEIKNEQQKLEQEAKRKKLDENDNDGLVDEISSLRKKRKRLSLEEKEFEDLAKKMGEIREMIRSPLSRLYNLAADKGFDIKKRPLSTAIGLTGVAANVIVNQDKVPPIFGILVKAITGGLIFVSGIIEKKIGLLVDKIRGFDPGADELVRIDPILKEIYAINKKMALELATLKIKKFKDDVIEKGIKEKNELNLSRSERFERTFNESVLNKVNNIQGTEKIDAELTNPNTSFQPRRTNNILINRVDELINLVKIINNQFDPEEDRERYNAEISWRTEVLNKLEALRTGKIEPEKSTFGFLESGALASIATFVNGIIANVTKFISPLALLGKSLLKFAAPLSIVSALVMTLDWNKDIIQPISKIKSTFADGKYVEGIFKSIALPLDIVTAFINRSVAGVAGLFGFEEIEKEFKNIADRVNFVDSIRLLSNNLISYVSDITTTLNSNFISLKDRLIDSLASITEIVNKFDITKTISDIFKTINDKIESLKFWKSDRSFEMPEFIQKLVPDKIKQNIDSIKIQNQNNINNISKLDTSKNIKQLTSTHERLITKQTEKDNNKIDRLAEKIGNINTSIVNQQVNNSNVTSISGRPRARIEDIYSHRNHQSDFSGYQIS